MEKHERQGQHRIPQVYLKQFGYPKEKPCWISVLGKETGMIRNVLIKNFTVETNVFDLPYKSFKIRRHFENISGTLESAYNRIISTIHNQKKIARKDKSLLSHFVANLLCRSRPFRLFIESILSHSPKSREKLIFEICIFKGISEGTKRLLNSFDEEKQLNIVMCLVADYLGKALFTFNYVVIKACANKMWFTTDNPVYINKHNSYNIVIPLETEIYLPLSRDYCLFMFHEEGEIKSNPFRNLRVDKVNIIDDLAFDNLVNEINLNESDYLISPIEMEETNLPPKKTY
jgi:Protein of unknown function (DUF4238)